MVSEGTLHWQRRRLAMLGGVSMQGCWSSLARLCANSPVCGGGEGQGRSCHRIVHGGRDVPGRLVKCCLLGDEVCVVATAKSTVARCHR
jgi:hypothetical protein